MLSRLLPVSLALVAASIVCIVALDEPFARWLATRETYPAFWNTVVAWLEYPLGIEPYKWTGVWILTAGSIVTLAVARLRPYAGGFLLVALVHFLGRNITMWMKYGTGRLRPSQWFATGGDLWFRDGAYSFPSGHAVLFASILVPLAVVHPRTRPLLVIVLFAMTARVAVSAHFLSDVLAGLALTTLLTWLCAQWLRRALPSSIRPASLQ